MNCTYFYYCCSFLFYLFYDRLYYQLSPTRLSACPLTVHALLHIADGIAACGPVWAYWAFPMERYCARLQHAVFNSRRHPYATLDKFVIEDAMLTQLKMRYNLFSELRFSRQPNENHGFCVPACEYSLKNKINLIQGMQSYRFYLYSTSPKFH